MAIQILPQKQPFDSGQITRMTQSISNLFNVVEQQRVKNEEKSIQSIISTVSPMGPDGLAKSPFEINQEIKSKIDLSRKQKGKPGLFDIFNTSFSPQGPTPTEQALNQTAIGSLFGVQGQQRSERDRLIKNRLVEAQITATQQLGAQRGASAFGVKPSVSKSITDDLQDTMDAYLSSQGQASVSLRDRTSKGTGKVAFELLKEDPTGTYRAVYNKANSLNIPKAEIDAQLNSIIQGNFSEFPEVEQLHNLLERGIDVDKLLNATAGLSSKLANRIIDKQTITLPRSGEFSAFKAGGFNVDDELMDAMRSLGKGISMEDGIYAITENIYDNDDLDTKQKNNLIDFIEDGLSFEDDDRELEIAKGNINIYIKMNKYLAILFNESKDNDDYRNKYKEALETFAKLDNLDEALTKLLKK